MFCMTSIQSVMTLGNWSIFIETQTNMQTWTSVTIGLYLLPCLPTMNLVNRISCLTGLILVGLPFSGQSLPLFSPSFLDPDLPPKHHHEKNQLGFSGQTWYKLHRNITILSNDIFLHCKSVRNHVICCICTNPSELALGKDGEAIGNREKEKKQKHIQEAIPGVLMTSYAWWEKIVTEGMNRCWSLLHGARSNSDTQRA